MHIQRLLQKCSQKHDPAPTHIDIYSKKLKTEVQRDTCSSMFITTLLKITKSGNDPQQNMVYTYNGILYSCNHEKEQSPDTGNNMDEPWKN